MKISAQSKIVRVEIKIKTFDKNSHSRNNSGLLNINAFHQSFPYLTVNFSSPLLMNASVIEIMLKIIEMIRTVPSLNQEI